MPEDNSGSRSFLPPCGLELTSDPQLDISTLPAESFCWPPNVNTCSETHLCHLLSICHEVFTKLSCQNHYAKLSKLRARTLTVVAQN